MNWWLLYDCFGTRIRLELASKPAIKPISMVECTTSIVILHTCVVSSLIYILIWLRWWCSYYKLLSGTWKVHYSWYSGSLFSISLCSLLSWDIIMLYKSFSAIYLLYLKQLLGFFILSIKRILPRIHLVITGWMICVRDLIMIFICSLVHW